MIVVVIKGLLVGLSIALFFGFGPSFFAVFQTALYKGYWRGALMAFGVFLSDVLMVTVSLLGAKSVVENSEKYEVLGIIGGLILIVFGIVILKKKTLRTDKDENFELIPENPHPAFCIGKGFLLNIANPFIWIFWAGMVMGVAAPLKAQHANVILFFGTALLTIFAVDLTKVIIANKIKPIINDKFLIGINRAAGIMLIIFGVTLLIKTVIEYSGMA
jgi:threonine/homoserine/homoserine lactone efflux protein